MAKPWRIQIAIDSEQALMRTWEPGTRKGHGAGLLRYAEYCALRDIPERNRFPTSEELIIGFIGWASGSLGHGAVNTWLSGLRAWHLFHGFPWPWEGSARIKAAVTACKKMAPRTSKRPPRAPVTIQHLNALHAAFDFTNNFDIACWAVICIAFWALPRLGEVTVPSIAGYDKSRHAPRSTAIKWEVHKSTRSVSLDIPWTKTTLSQGATLHITEEKHELSCPYRAFQNHLAANSNVPPEGHLFGFATAAGGWQPMVKRSVM